MFKPISELEGDSRGQLVLIGAIVTAALLVILVLILNGVLYTENIATREQPQSIDRGVDMASMVEGTTSDLIDFENEELYETEGAGAANIHTDIENTETLMNERQFEAHGELIDIRSHNIQPAWIVVQEEENNFTSADQPLISVFSQWELAVADGIRDGHMTVTTADTFDPSEDSQALDVFRVRVEGDGGSDWTIFIFEHPTQNRIAITDGIDADGNPDLSRACVSDGIPAEIDFVDMTIDGNECDFDFAENVGSGPYELSFGQGEAAQGTYEFVLGKGDNTELGTGGVLTTTEYVLNTMDGEDADPEQPTAYDGVYSVTADLSIDGEDVELEAHTYAAPRQPAETTSSEQP